MSDQMNPNLKNLLPEDITPQEATQYGKIGCANVAGVSAVLGGIPFGTGGLITGPAIGAGVYYGCAEAVEKATGDNTPISTADITCNALSGAAGTAVTVGANALGRLLPGRFTPLVPGAGAWWLVRESCYKLFR